MPTSATVRRGLFVRSMLRGGEDLQAVRIAFRVDSASSGLLEGVPQLWKVGSSFLQLMWSRRLPVFGKEQRVKACGFLRGLFVFPSGMENIQAQSPCLELCATCWVYNLTSSNQETSCAVSQRVDQRDQ